MTLDARQLGGKTPQPVFNPDGTNPRSLLQYVEALARAGRGTYMGDDEFGRPTWALIEEPVSVAGPTRVGKTRSVYVPSLITFPGTAIATSVKTDLRDLTIDARRMIAATYGGRVLELDFTGDAEVVADRITWDPTTNCDSWTIAKRRAAILARLTVKSTRTLTGRRE